MTQSTSRNERAYALRDAVFALFTFCLLTLVLMPTLAGGPASSSAETCRNNLRQLIQAWSLYAEDSGGKLMPNNGANPGTTGTWVRGWLDFSSSFDNINTDFLVGYDGPLSNQRYGHAGPYLQSSDVFRCPSDFSTVKIFGKQQARVRSVTMNSWMGGIVYCGQNQFRSYRRLDEVATPANRMVILEVRPDAINDGSFYMDMVNWFVDMPAFHHSSGCWISFADGRVEYRRWTDSRTLPGFRPETLIPLNQPSPNNPDLDWLRERTTELK